MNPFNFDEEALRKEQEAADEKKGLLGVFGSALQDTVNVPSGYEMLYNKKIDRPDIKGSFDAVAKQIKDPTERRGKLYEQYKMGRDFQRDRDAELMLAEKKDPNSNISKVRKMMAARFGIEAKPEMSAHDIEQLIDLKKMKEIEAGSLSNMEKQLAIARENNKMDLAKQQALFSQQSKRDLAQHQRDLELAGLKNRIDQENKAAQEKKDRETSYGLARTADDAKKLKDASEQKAKLDRQISELIELRKEYGAEVMNRDAVERGKQLSNELLLTKKNLENLGVLSQSDTAIIDAIIPKDPLAFSLGQLRGQDPILSRLEKFKSDTEADFQERLRNRIVDYAPKENRSLLSQEDQAAQAWALKNPGDPRSRAIMENINRKASTAGR